MKPETRKFLDDLKAAGLDISSIERQVNADPLADRQADSLIGGGILRQQEYSRYMNDLKTEKETLQAQVQQLATLHDAKSSGIDLPQQALDAIGTLEKSLIDGGFDEEAVKNISYQARVPLEKMIKDSKANPNPINPQPQQFQVQQPQPFDTSQFVDVNTLRQAMGNLAYGDIATTMEINARIDEVRQLGIPVTRKEIALLQQNLKKNFEGGGDLDSAFEETFKVSEAMTAKQNAEIDKRINEEADKRAAEILKTAGVPVIKKFDFGRRHVIFDKNKQTPVNTQPQTETKEGDPPKELPVNKFGDVELFRSRRTRDDRMQNAAQLHEKVMEKLADDITYVDY